jgi:hypothetical protein
MARSKAQQNAMALDPQRQMIAKNMSVLPGGPQNNNPMNVTDNASPAIQSTSIYGDYAQNYPQMGTGMINPMQVGPSGLQQNFPVMRGKNAQAPYGMQQQPDTRPIVPTTDVMESMRLGMGVQEGLPRGAMGYQGMPAIPGAIPGQMPGMGGQMLPTLDSMVPGSSPQKTGQKKKGGKK